MSSEFCNNYMCFRLLSQMPTVPALKAFQEKRRKTHWVGNKLLF